jgi:energy-converting hydrogenase Eha subunit C
LNQLPTDRPVYLLELGRLLEYNYDPYGEGDGESDEQDSSYLQFILKSPALMAAFGFGLLGVLLFVLFRSKRMQPIVPYIEKKKNMSLEFAQTITSIYLSKSNPMGILKVQRQNFYDAMQKHFFVDISRKAKDRERSIRILSEKTSIAESELMELIDLFEPKNQNELNENYLAQVNTKQRSIYVRTNIISDRIIERIEGKNTVIQRNLLFSVALILLGIFIVLLGFYYLVVSIGVGIVFWPIGAIFLIIGIRRINRPLLLITPDTVTFYQTFGRKSSLAVNDLMRISTVKNAYILYFKEDKTLKIKKIELSKFDKSQLERFIAKHHNLEL